MPLDAAVKRLDTWYFSEQLANAFCEFSIGLGMEEMCARRVAHVAEAEPGPPQIRKFPKTSIPFLFILLQCAHNRRLTLGQEALSRYRNLNMEQLRDHFLIGR